MQIEAISWADMHSYFGLLDIRPARWELRAIRALDAAFLASRTNPARRAVVGAKALRSSMTGNNTEA